MGIKTGSKVAAICAAAAMLTACGSTENEGTPSEGGQCASTIEFQGRIYVEHSTSQNMSHPPKTGRKLGTAHLRHCPNSDADGPPSGGLTIYEIVGTPPSQAVFADPLVGVMEFERLGDGER